jgi:hypothetical protein
MQNYSSWILISISACALLISSLSFGINSGSLYLLFSHSQVKARVPKFSALATTLYLTWIACLFIMLQTIYQICSHFSPRTSFYGTNKESSLIYFNLTTTTLSFFFAVSAALNVSLVLIEIADRVSKGSSNIYVNVYLYRRTLIGYGLIFAILLIIFAALGRAQWSFIAAAPAALFIAISFFYAWFRLRRIFHDNKTIASAGNTARSINKTLQNIRITTLCVSLCASGLIVCGILQVFLDPLNRPDASLGAIPGRVLWVFGACFMLVITRYVRVHISGKLIEERKESSQPKRLSNEKKPDRTALLVAAEQEEEGGS